MKGVSEVIAIVLILLIVIALAALAYTWFSGIFADLMRAAENALSGTSRAMSLRFEVENALYNQTQQNAYISVRNTGNQPFDAAKTSFYINNIVESFDAVNCPGCDCNNLAQGCVANFDLLSIGWASMPSGSSVRVTIESGLQSSKEITIVI